MKLGLRPGQLRVSGQPFEAVIHPDLVHESMTTFRAFGRLLAPSRDLVPLLAREIDKIKDQPAVLREDKAFDVGPILAKLEVRDRSIVRVRDEELSVVSHHGSPLHLHIGETRIPGPYHLGVWLDGEYRPAGIVQPQPGHGHETSSPSSASGAGGERFTRLLTLSTALARPSAAKKPTMKKNAAPKQKRKKGA